MYSHTQRGGVVIIATALVTPIVFVSTLPFSPPAALLAAALTVGVLALFWSLTISVDGEKIRARFGPGLIRFSWDRADVMRARAAETPWYYGWGIRYFGGGWLYNVSGTRSVELLLKGDKTIRLGTDDVEGLLAALDAD